MKAVYSAIAALGLMLRDCTTKIAPTTEDKPMRAQSNVAYNRITPAIPPLKLMKGTTVNPIIPAMYAAIIVPATKPPKPIALV